MLLENIEQKEIAIKNMEEELKTYDFRGKGLKKKEIEAKVYNLRKEVSKLKKEEENIKQGFKELKEKINEAKIVNDVVKLIPFAIKSFGEDIVSQKARKQRQEITWEHISIAGITNLALAKINEIQANVIRKSKEIRILNWIKMSTEEVQKAEKEGILAGYDPDQGLGAIRV